MSSLRVSCEFAGSGHHIKTFDFVSKTCNDLEIQINQYDASALLCNMRLFWNHSGRELTVPAGLFGRQRTRAHQESHTAWLALKQRQKKNHEQTSEPRAPAGAAGADDTHHDVVIAVAAYDDTHVLLKYSTEDQVTKLAYRVAATTNAYQAIFAGPCTFTASNMTMEFPEKAIRFDYKSLLHNSRVMFRLVKTTPDVTWINLPVALRHDMDFMAAARSVSHLASEELLKSEEFARLAFQKPRHGLLPCLYALLSSKLQACRDVAVLALCSEGTSVLDAMPNCLLDDLTFVQAVMSSWAWSTTKENIDIFLAHTSHDIRYSPEIVQLYYVTTRFSNTRFSNTSKSTNLQKHELAKARTLTNIRWRGTSCFENKACQQPISQVAK